jgi:DNA-binding SARP family transcriptional activator
MGKACKPWSTTAQWELAGESLEFGLLGPLIVRQGDRPLPISFGNQRVLLAALLARANQVVSLDDVAELIWDAHPPRSARVTTQNYIKRLRQALGRDEGRERIRTHPGGYLIRTSQAELDLAQFRELCAAGLEAARQRSWEIASERLMAAVALWRGQPFSDIPCEALAHREASWLGEQRLQALEARIDADLHLGRHYQVISELQQLISAEPLRERLHALLLLALYRCGQQAVALDAYRQARQLLADNTGMDPGPGLRQLHQRILRSDPSLMLAAPPAPVTLLGHPPAAAATRDGRAARARRPQTGAR